MRGSLLRASCMEPLDAGIPVDRIRLWKHLPETHRMPKTLPITSGTIVAELLDHYPELEDVLISMAPPFKRLKNPALRKSVAKIVSLRQAAAVGRVPIAEMINRLRASVGQSPLEDNGADATDYFTSQPEWFDQSKVVATLDERRVDPDVMPLKPLLEQVTQLAQGEIVELVTTHLPVPGIDIMKSKGYVFWAKEQGPLIKTYFAKAK